MGTCVLASLAMLVTITVTDLDGAQSAQAATSTRYSGVEFRNLYNNLGPPARTARITGAPSITGHAAADARIQRLAQARGYRLRSEHRSGRVAVGGHGFDPTAATALRALIADAGRHGHWLGVRSGYRSVSTQRGLFVRRLGGRSGATLASGRADGTIEAALRWVAPPGYSKHHTGHTVDFSASGGRAFGGSAVERWLAADNYANAKRHGFIPSYPPGAGAQGPDPEPWEFVYVGTATIRCGRHLAHGNRTAFDRCVRPPSAIERHHASLGGAVGVLGPLTVAERPVAGPAAAGGRVARYRNGSIYWSPTTGARALWGRIQPQYAAQGGVGGSLGYPTSNIATTGDGRARYSRFQRGVIFSMQDRGVALTVAGPIYQHHRNIGGSRSLLRYPTSNARAIKLPRGGRVQVFEGGRLIEFRGRVHQLHGTIDTAYASLGGAGGPFGYPTSSIQTSRDGKGRVQLFEGGKIWSLPSAGLPGRGVRGPTLTRYAAGGDVAGYLGYPTSSTGATGDGTGMVTVFERGRIYDRGGIVHQVHGAVHDRYLAEGGAQGALGYPVSDLDPQGAPGSRFQLFERGSIERHPDGSLTVHLA